MCSELERSSVNVATILAFLVRHVLWKTSESRLPDDGGLVRSHDSWAFVCDHRSGV